jgi:hypothetical protein
MRAGEGFPPFPALPPPGSLLSARGGHDRRVVRLRGDAVAERTLQVTASALSRYLSHENNALRQRADRTTAESFAAAAALW